MDVLIDSRLPRPITIRLGAPPMKSALAAALLLAAAAAPAAAHAAPIQALNPWSRPAAAGGNGAGYVTLVNSGPADALVGVETPVAQKAELHASTMSGNVMRMAQEARTPIPAGGRVSFAPGGRHIMLIGLKRPLRLGDRVPATLRFASGASLKLELAVTAAPPAAAEAHHAGHAH